MAGHYLYEHGDGMEEIVIEITDHAPFFAENHIDGDKILEKVDWGALQNGMEVYVETVKLLSGPILDVFATR